MQNEGFRIDKKELEIKSIWTTNLAIETEE